MKTLGNFCEFKYGKNLLEKSRNGGDFPVYGSNGIVGYHDVPLTAGETIIIGRKGSAGALQYSSVSCCPIDTTYYVDRTCTNVDLRWLFFMLQNLGLEKLNKHVAVPGLNRNDAYKKELLVPPLDEQKRIAAVLDKADALRRQRQESLQLSEKLLQSVFINMFGDPVINPKGWPLVNFGQEMEKISYGTSVKCSETSEDGSHTVLRIPNVASGEINWADLKFATFTEDVWSNSKLIAGDILFVRTNGNPSLVARTAVFDGSREATFASYIIRVRLKKRSKLKPEFINYLLSMPPWRARLLQLARTSAGNYNINTQAIKELEVIAPEMELQDRFCQAVKHQRAFVETIQESRSLSDLLFSSVQQRAFKGELNLNRLKLEPEKPFSVQPTKQVAKLITPKASTQFIKIPTAIKPALKKLDQNVSKGEVFPWSEDYFQYRILGQLLEAPYTFAQIWNVIEQRMPETNYGVVKDKIFEFLANGILRQRFDKKQRALVFFPRRR